MKITISKGELDAVLIRLALESLMSDSADRIYDAVLEQAKRDGEAMANRIWRELGVK